MPDQAVLVWIESGAGRIVRGQAESIGSEGVHVRFTGEPDFGQGDEVAVRVGFDRGARTVAATARVDQLGAGEDAVECDLRWTPTAEQRAALDAWLVHAA